MEFLKQESSAVRCLNMSHQRSKGTFPRIKQVQGHLLELGAFCRSYPTRVLIYRNPGLQLSSICQPHSTSILPSNNRQQSVIAMNPSVTQHPAKGASVSLSESETYYTTSESMRDQNEDRFPVFAHLHTTVHLYCGSRKQPGHNSLERLPARYQDQKKLY